MHKSHGDAPIMAKTTALKMVIIITACLTQRVAPFSLPRVGTSSRCAPIPKRLRVYRQDLVRMVQSDVQESSEASNQVHALISKLLTECESCDRGFNATKSQQDSIRQLISEIKIYNPTKEPATSFYPDSMASNKDSEASLDGQWTLLWTDAPDILALKNQSPLSEVGDIGQNYLSREQKIENVIQWKPKEWVKASVGVCRNDDVEQRVVLRGKASPNNPSRVELSLEGIDVEAKTVFGQPFAPDLTLKVPFGLALPFGTFDVLYLDDCIRITRTLQGFYAINSRRPDEARSGPLSAS